MDRRASSSRRRGSGSMGGTCLRASWKPPTGKPAASRRISRKGTRNNLFPRPGRKDDLDLEAIELEKALLRAATSTLSGVQDDLDPVAPVPKNVKRPAVLAFVKASATASIDAPVFDRRVQCYEGSRTPPVTSGCQLSDDNVRIIGRIEVLFIELHLGSAARQYCAGERSECERTS